MAGGWTTTVLLLLCWLQVSISEDGDPLTGVTTLLPVAPSHGDVKRMCNGLVMIYMGPDGDPEYPQMWGTLRGDNATVATVTDTLCHQLGYGDGGDHQLRPFKVASPECVVEREDFPVWLSKMHCNESKNHILRCDYKFNMTTDHGYDTYVKCWGNATHSPFDGGSHSYIGQVSLFAPSSMNNYNATRSSGMVILKNNRKRNTWSYIIKKSLIGRKIADTVCRAMGFTHAVLNSVITKSLSDQIYSYDHNYDQWRLSSSILSSNINCQDSCQCLGCCMDPSIIDEVTTITQNLSNANGFPSSVVNYPDALIIRCTFSEAAANFTSGSEDLCEFSSTKLAIQHPEVCPITSTAKMYSLEEREFIAVVAAPVAFLLLVIIGILFIPRAYRKARGWYANRPPGYQVANVVEENN